MRTAQANGWTARTVRGLRARLGLSQEAFARRLGVSFTTVNRWERGKVVPTGLYAEKLNEIRWPEGKGSGPRPKRVVIPSDQVEAFGGPTEDQMREIWGSVPPSVFVEMREIKPLWGSKPNLMPSGHLTVLLQPTSSMFDPIPEMEEESETHESKEAPRDA